MDWIVWIDWRAANRGHLSSSAAAATSWRPPSRCASSVPWQSRIIVVVGQSSSPAAAVTSSSSSSSTDCWAACWWSRGLADSAKIDRLSGMNISDLNRHGCWEQWLSTHTHTHTVTDAINYTSTTIYRTTIILWQHWIIHSDAWWLLKTCDRCPWATCQSTWICRRASGKRWRWTDNYQTLALCPSAIARQLSWVHHQARSPRVSSCASASSLKDRITSFIVNISSLVFIYNLQLPLVGLNVYSITCIQNSTSIFARPLSRRV